MTSDNYAALCRALGYQFVDWGLLRQALTHRSVINEDPSGGADNNERLEFLGDAVVNLSIGKRMMELLPDAREGSLSKLRASVVSEGSLAAAAQQVGLGELLRLGKGEELTGGREKPSILADAFEAVIGAILLDGGFVQADRVVRQKLSVLVTEAVGGALDRDHKTRLQEVVQAQFRQIPKYRIVDESGPDHAKVFAVEVSLGEQVLARAHGASKKEAEQEAARLALDCLVDRR
jgi:ribonuclease-3